LSDLPDCDTVERFVGPSEDCAHMPDPVRLNLVRAAHSTVYIVMGISAFTVLYAGLTGRRSAWIWVAVVLLLGEAVVYIANGWSCPLTTLEVKYGSKTGHAFDWLAPERAMRYTFRSLTVIAVVGLMLLVLRQVGVIA